jgi:hypothetical protein
MPIAQDCGGENFPSQLEDRGRVQNDAHKFGEENPEIMSPQSVTLVFCANPALEDVSEDSYPQIW